MNFRLSKSDKNILGTIRLDGSKSISNRVLIIQSLCKDPFEIIHRSTSKDSDTLHHLLHHPATTLDAGHAGTTFRFMTAYLSMHSGTQVLTGSDRMKERPIGVLVKALKTIGADIEYLEKEGYPPLSIGTGDLTKTNEIDIVASTSSQFISALLLIAPTLPNGLILNLVGDIVSRPYIQMTLSLMEYFGIQYQWDDQTIRISKQEYQARDFVVEADWSAASYYYALAAFADELDLQLDGLFKDSLQGDAILARMMTEFGIQTTFNETGIHLSKDPKISPNKFEWDFKTCPDIAQTLAVICGGLGVEGYFKGLKTLKIKETDRVAALQNELKKVNVDFWEVPSDEGVYCQAKGQAVIDNPTFETYQDHRMAMAFAPLAMFAPIDIDTPMVVKKSYPNFYVDLEQLGFIVEKFN